MTATVSLLERLRNDRLLYGQSFMLIARTQCDKCHGSGAETSVPNPAGGMGYQTSCPACSGVGSISSLKRLDPTKVVFRDGVIAEAKE